MVVVTLAVFDPCESMRKQESLDKWKFPSVKATIRTIGSRKDVVLKAANLLRRLHVLPFFEDVEAFHSYCPRPRLQGVTLGIAGTLEDRRRPWCLCLLEVLVLALPFLRWSRPDLTKSID